MKDINCVVHLAFVTNIPYSVQNPIATTYDNIDMTIKFLKFVQIIMLTGLFFLPQLLYLNNKVPWKEDMLPDAIEPYSWQKLSCENMMKM